MNHCVDFENNTVSASADTLPDTAPGSDAYELVTRAQVGALITNLPERDVCRGNLETYKDFLFFGYYDKPAGFTVTPIRSKAAHRAAVALADEGLISSLQDSDRQDFVYHMRNGVTDAGGWGGLVGAVRKTVAHPQRGAYSRLFDTLNRVHQQETGVVARTARVWPRNVPLPVVISANNKYVTAHKPSDAPLWFQPTPDWAARTYIPC